MEWTREVETEDSGKRLDAYWAAALAEEGVSRQKIKGWIKDGLARVNDTVRTKANFRLSAGDSAVLQGEGAEIMVLPEPGGVEALFEDEDIVVLNKPSGLVTHPAPGCMENTLVQRLLAVYPQIEGMDKWRPGIVHRLDKDTSGVMVVALNEPARLALAGDFAARHTRKRYLALVHGVPDPAKGTVEAPIGRHPNQRSKMAVVEKGGKEAVSDYEILWSSPDRAFSLVGVRIHTGRTHQVRVHMAHLGHPLVGDVAYGPADNSRLASSRPGLSALAPRTMLHAFRLEFEHPVSREAMSFVQPVPDDFLELARSMCHRTLRAAVVGQPCGGKSFLCEHLRREGLPVFSADACVAGLYEAGGDGAYMINSRWPGRFEATGGAVDKKALFKAMVEDGNLRREIMDMIHPMVRAAMERFMDEKRGEEIVIAEIPLLLETGWKDHGLNPVVGIDCPQDMRRSFAGSRGWDEDTLALFDSWQWPGEAKMKACDIVVENPGTASGMEETAKNLVRRLRDMRRATTDDQVDLIASRMAEYSRGDE